MRYLFIGCADRNRLRRGNSIVLSDGNGGRRRFSDRGRIID